MEYQKGDSIFLTAGSGSYQIEGSCDAVITTIREKQDLVRIGMDVGGKNTKITLALKSIAGKVTELLEENNIPMEQYLVLKIRY